MKKFIFTLVATIAIVNYGYSQNKGHISVYSDIQLTKTTDRLQMTNVYITADFGLKVSQSSSIELSIGYAPEIDAVSAMRGTINYHYRPNVGVIAPYIKLQVGGKIYSYLGETTISVIGACIQCNIGADIRLAKESSLFCGVGVGGDFFKNNNTFYLQPQIGLRFYF